MGISAIITAIIAFGVSALLGVWLVPFLHKLKYGQTILDIGPSWHKNKQGTPTMGGIMFIVGSLIAIITGLIIFSAQGGRLFDGAGSIYTIRMIAGVIMALAYGFTGFIDDYIKVVKKRNLGLTVTQKLVSQITIAALYLLAMYLYGDRSTTLVIPFIGQWDIGIFYYIFAMILIVGAVNATNLTDGIDGLAGSVTFTASLALCIISGILSFAASGLVSIALAGGCLGFLVWNFYPAKTFMGDTGSLFLGGMIVALCFAIGLPVLWFFVGIIYLIEAFSVILQVISFKTTGKRIFKMSPIHHHFELSGWSEVKIVTVFVLITAVFAVLGIVGTMMVS